MLTYNKDTDEVEIVKEALAIPAVKSLWNADKIGDKSYFKRVIKWVYHMYSSNHILNNLPYKERKNIVLRSYFNGRMPANIENNKRVFDFIETYQLLEKGVDERLAEAIKEAVAVEKEKIAGLSTVRMEKIEIPYELNYDFAIYKKNDKGEFVKMRKEELKGTVKTEVEINDSQILIAEVDRAFKLSSQYEEALRRAKIEKEELKVKYEGMSLLEKFHAMNPQEQSAYLKDDIL